MVRAFLQLYYRAYNSLQLAIKQTVKASYRRCSGIVKDVAVNVRRRAYLRMFKDVQLRQNHQRQVIPRHLASVNLVMNAPLEPF
jgi:hypothetical protein